jgi:hypothetical protein
MGLHVSKQGAGHFCLWQFCAIDSDPHKAGRRTQAAARPSYGRGDGVVAYTGVLGGFGAGLVGGAFHHVLGA